MAGCELWHGNGPRSHSAATHPAALARRTRRISEKIIAPHCLSVGAIRTYEFSTRTGLTAVHSQYIGSKLVTFTVAQPRAAGYILMIDLNDFDAYSFVRSSQSRQSSAFKCRSKTC